MFLLIIIFHSRGQNFIYCGRHVLVAYHMMYDAYVLLHWAIQVIVYICLILKSFITRCPVTCFKLLCSLDLAHALSMLGKHSTSDLYLGPLTHVKLCFIVCWLYDTKV